MKSESLLKHLGVALGIALVFYLGAFHWIETRRHRTGPWQVQFAAEVGGSPTVIINQHRLGITNVQLAFPEAGAVPGQVAMLRAFDSPRPVPEAVAFAEVIFTDLTFLPGTVTLQLFGHEVELLPRVLIIDRKEQEWRSGLRLDIRGPGVSSGSGSSKRPRP